VFYYKSRTIKIWQVVHCSKVRIGKECRWMQVDGRGRKIIEGEQTGKANEEAANWEADEYTCG